MMLKLFAIVLIIAAVQFSEVKTLKCYACASTTDWASCNDVKKEMTCPAGMDKCGKVEISGKASGVDVKMFGKSCTIANQCGEANDQCKKVKQQGADIKCEVSCCSGDLCNAGSVPLVSAIVMMSCALIAALSHIL